MTDAELPASECRRHLEPSQSLYEVHMLMHASEVLYSREAGEGNRPELAGGNGDAEITALDRGRPCQQPQQNVGTKFM